MRHLKAGRKLGRTSAHRKALFRNLVGALILRERISTTMAKAKELRGKVEKTITLGKKGTLHARRQAFKLAPQKETVQKVFGPLAAHYKDRPAKRG
jgi:large subunit ribosomal protein L17